MKNSRRTTSLWQYLSFAQAKVIDAALVTKWCDIIKQVMQSFDTMAKINAFGAKQLINAWVWVGMIHSKACNSSNLSNKQTKTIPVTLFKNSDETSHQTALGFSHISFIQQKYLISRRVLIYFVK
mmetsp:Transcript_16986/g.30809  ORF Transcript_16986/g.30809 Transcript_16986/m.30809 type:complete len:125 (+) Transcript_16986:671-1045(+)